MDTIAPTHTITVAQAAEALEVSERTVWRYLKSGRLPGETVGEPGSQRTLIPTEAVDALRGRRAGGDADALRAERDRLVAELAMLRAERDTLHGRVAYPPAGAVGAEPGARRAGPQPRPGGGGARPGPARHRPPVAGTYPAPFVRSGGRPSSPASSGVPALEVLVVLVGHRARRVVLRIEVGVDVLRLAGEALVHRVEVRREPAVRVVHVLAVVLHDLDRLVGGPLDLAHHLVRLEVRLRLVRLVLRPLALEERVDRLAHVGVVRRGERLVDPVTADGDAGAALGVGEAEAEAGDVHPAEGEAGDVARVRPAAEAHRLQGEGDVLADERLLDDLHRQDPLLQLDDPHLAVRVEPAGVHPLLQPARLVAVGLVHQREAVLGREVDEQQVDVLERHVRHRQEQRRARLVGVPVVEHEQARQALRHLRPAVLELLLRPPDHLEDEVDLGVAALVLQGRDLAVLGHEVPHVEEVEAVVVGEEELGAVVGAGARPGAGRPLHHRVRPHRGVDVAEVEAGEAGAHHEQQRLLQLGEGDRLVGAVVAEGPRHRHPEPHPAALAVEDRLEERVAEAVVEARGVGESAAHSPSSLLMMSCWISLVPSVMEASLASR